jgi:hypothetical protein
MESKMETRQIFESKRPKVISAYQELTNILEGVKKNDITIQDAMNLIQIRETPKPNRPYCKVSDEGMIQLYGVADQMIQMYGDEWEKMIKTMKSGYMDNYMKYNEYRIRKSDGTSYRKSLFSEDEES